MKHAIFPTDGKYHFMFPLIVYLTFARKCSCELMILINILLWECMQCRNEEFKQYLRYSNNVNRVMRSHIQSGLA